MSRSSALCDWLVIISAWVLGLGSILLFALFPLGSLSMVRASSSEFALLGWDTFVSFVFFVQHSLMNRRWFRDWLAPHVEPRYRAAVYGIASGAALLFVVLSWEPSSSLLWTIRGEARLLSYALSVVCFGLFVWAAVALRTFDPLGLRPIQLHRRHEALTTPDFVVRGPYRWVRHPLYSCILVSIWAWPDVTSDRLLFASLWTAWMVLGARLEEMDLSREFGERYEAYRRAVPMLIPWRAFAKRRIDWDS